MHDGVELRRGPAAVLPDPLQLVPVGPLEDAVAGDVEALAADVLAHAAQHAGVVDAGALQQRRQVVGGEVLVGAAVRLARARRVLGQDALAGEGAVALAAAVGVAADVAVGVPHVVAVLLVEGALVRLGGEGAPPEQEALVQAEAQALEEERVLQAPEVAEVRVGAQRAVEVRHAEGEVLRGEGVDGGGVDGSAGERGVGVGEVGEGSREGVRKMC